MSGPLARHLGFTGTRYGLSAPQRGACLTLFRGFHWLHHGDCVGADAEAHALARSAGLNVVLHPPTVDETRAFCDSPWGRLPLPYLERDRAIVEATEQLVACPLTETEERRSGTWATVRYARKLHRPLVLVFPSGRTITERLDLSHRGFEL